MSYEDTRPYGKPEGLGKRLAMWANQLGHDTKYPWAGLGLIDDLNEAARQLGANPDKLYPDALAATQKPVQTGLAYKAQEYDL